MPNNGKRIFVFQKKGDNDESNVHRQEFAQ